MVNQKVLKVALVLVLLAALCSCASAPTIRSSQVIGSVNAEKIQQLQLVYRQAAIKSRSSTNWGRGAVASDMGFDTFGSLLTIYAKDVFGGRGVAVEGASIVSDGEIAPTLKLGTGIPMPMLVVSPQTATTHANSMSTRASYVFSVLILDPLTGVTRWKASLDMSTWSGKDFVMKNFKETVLDETYARQFLNAVIEQMKTDGLI